MVFIFNIFNIEYVIFVILMNNDYVMLIVFKFFWVRDSEFDKFNVLKVVICWFDGFKNVYRVIRFF